MLAWRFAGEYAWPRIVYHHFNRQRNTKLGEGNSILLSLPHPQFQASHARKPGLVWCDDIVLLTVMQAHFQRLAGQDVCAAHAYLYRVRLPRDPAKGEPQCFAAVHRDKDALAPVTLHLHPPL